ncbi:MULTISPECIES: zinc-dependent alcohol dehydrogenase family protein [Rhodomicrobium]|uniref:zinc-dependent alcohol dehydrogenase family protein n=1 Tax=Rhodomicrobium TaxID=1068 RepID=UPI000B4BFD20|nr:MULTISPECIES: zinc-dependent alcohol dehydrogenase family protein [Rhodomicrobium]
MKIRAAVLEEMGRQPPYAQSLPLTIGEIELQGPKSGEVLVKMAAAGLCHSDLSVIDGNRPRPVPMVLGHEAAGIVEEVGANVHDLKPGDHVALVFVPSCGHCLPCASGRPALCEPAAAAGGAGTLLSGERRLSRDGHDLNHLLGVAAFAEYATCSRRSLVKIDPELPLDHAALFGCAVLTGVGAVVNTARIEPGSTVAVVGLGGVGLSTILGAVAAGAERIVAVDLAEDKLALAASLGATDAFVAGEGAAQAIKDATGGGVHYAFEMAGAVPALDLAYRITRRGGTTITAGLPNPNALLSLPALNLIAEERTLKGSYMGSAVPSRDIPRYIGLFKRGKLPVDRLLTRHIRLEDINEGFDRLREGREIRQILTFG